MIDFAEPQLEDILWAKDILQKSGRKGSEFCFGNIYMWCKAYNCTIAKLDDTILCRAGDSYVLPAGSGDLKKLVKELKKDSEDRNIPLKLHGLCESQKADLEEAFENEFDFYENRDSFDYIYSTEDLATLPGKKYHGKRNHISYFENNFDWTYEEMNPDNAKECLEFSNFWYKANDKKIRTGTDRELVAITRALSHFTELGFKGGILRVQGDIVAYTFGEPLSDTVFCTHVEKAVADIRGAYPMINREFARNTIAQYSLVNREEDMGIEGLRRAKESYKPKILLKKYIAILK